MSNDVDTPEVTTPQEAVKATRPLNATQARHLKELVDNDFGQLRQEIRQQGKDLIEKKKKELEERYNATQSEEYIESAVQMVNEFAQAVQDLVTQARRDGLILKMPTTSAIVGHNVTISDDRLQKAITDATTEINGEIETALNVLEKKRLQAMRRVLIAAITTDAEKILNDIPSASDLMVEAAQERAARKELR